MVAQQRKKEGGGGDMLGAEASEPVKEASWQVNRCHAGILAGR